MSYWENKRPLIVCFWHNRLLLQTAAWNSKMPLTMIISDHRDGRTIAQAVERLGIKTIAGSSSKGGANAFRKVLTLLKKKECIGLTPDGPRGPRFKVQTGVAQIAKFSGVDILPLVGSVRSRKVLKSWDKFIFPYPFNRGILIFGNPIKAPQSDEDIESTRHVIEINLQKLCEEADKLCGHHPLD